MRDTGVGFDPSERARLFRRFEQADTSLTRRVGGAGLGLAIARSLVRVMGGGLDARSMPGRGSTFRFVAPLARSSGPAPAPLPATAGVAASAARGLQVLVAEDHPVNRAVVELILSAADADITSVENGREALDALERRRFDIVLMDVQMPVMDGLMATRALRELERARVRGRRR